MPLPEKDFFTLDEVIERWKFAGCDRQTLLEYARRDLLVFSVYRRELGNHERDRETDEGLVTTRTVTALSFRSAAHVDRYAGPIWYLKGDDARRILECEDNEGAIVSVLFPASSRYSGTGTGHWGGLRFAPSDLRVTRAERDRFEESHPLTLGQRVAKRWAWLTEAKNQKALIVIGSAVGGGAFAAWTVVTYFWPSGIGH
jgi:hypothetical protein